MQKRGEQSGEIGLVGEGNPLFIEELAASVAEHAKATAGELPTTIRGIVSARLDALPPGERAVLLDAAVVGKVFWTGALERMSSGQLDLAELLDSLEGRDLIRREPDLPAAWRSAVQLQARSDPRRGLRDASTASRGVSDMRKSRPFSRRRRARFRRRARLWRSTGVKLGRIAELPNISSWQAI